MVMGGAMIGKGAMLVRIIAITILAVSLSACVSETTGGFNVQPSREGALADYIQLSNGYLQIGDLENTRRHLNNASDIDPNNGEVHGLWALLYAREGDLDLANDSFRRALRLDSSNSQTRNNYAAFLFSQNRFDDAYEELSEVVVDTNYIARPQAFENMGLAALQLNRLDDAEYAFGRALQLNSNQLRSSLELVDINLTRENILQARAYYRNFLTLIQFYNISHNARSLWSGIRLEQALGNESNVYAYGDILEESFSDSSEYLSYQQLLDQQAIEND